MTEERVTVARVEARGLDPLIPALAAVLRACVYADASLNFCVPFSQAESEAWWRQVAAPAVARGTRRLWVATMEGQPVGSVQLGTDLPDNQSHRADVMKLIVAPQARRRGIARRLMEALEAEAHIMGRPLLVLDTRTGDPSCGLYTSMGYQTVGQIPGYCRHPLDPQLLDDVTFFYKWLPPADP